MYFFTDAYKGLRKREYRNLKMGRCMGWLMIVFMLPLAGLAQQNVVTVTGTVINQKEEPVQSAAVRVVEENYHAYTDEKGNFILKLPQGNYTLMVTCIDYADLSEKISIGENKITDLGTLKLQYSEEKNLRDLKITSKTENQQLREQGFNVNVIDLKSQYNTSSNVADILNRTQGVRIREEGGLGSNFNFSLNGFSGNEVKFFLDGIPMDNFGPSLSINNFPVNMADHIEVYKGVLPVNLGTDALGGAVNIVTRKNLNYLDVSYSVGSFNTHRPALSTAYTANNGFTVRANLFYNYSDNNYKVLVPVMNLSTNSYDTPDQWVKRFHDKYESATGQLEVGVTGKKYADQLLFGFIGSQNNKDIQTGVTMQSVYGALKSKSSSLIPTLKYKKTNLLVKGLDLNLYAAYNINNFKRIDTTPRTYNWLGESVPKASSGSSAVGGEISRTQNENKNREFLNNANLVYKLNSWSGIALNDIYTHFKRTSFDVENPDAFANRFPSSLFKNVVGLTWNANIQEKWITTLFLKYYSMKAIGYQQVTQKDGTPEYQSVKFHYNSPSYGIATAYFINPALQVKGSFERAYRMPGSEEIFGDGVFVAYNPELKPEKSNNLNVGLRYNVHIDDASTFSAEAGFIYRNTEDFIRVDQSATSTVRQTINQGKVRTIGEEGELSYKYSNLFYLTVNATYQSIVDKEQYIENKGYGGGIIKNYTYGFKLPNIPYLFGNVMAGYNMPIGKNTLSFNYVLNYVQHYYLTFSELGYADANAQYIIPKQFAHNISVAYSLAKGKYNVAFECKNFTNSLLYDSYRLQKPGRSFSLKLRYFISKN